MITMYSRYDEITDRYPLLPASELKREWVSKACQAMARRQAVSKHRTTNATVGKCPGIRELLTTGYILTTWCDLTIRIEGNDLYIYYPDRMKRYLNTIDMETPPVSEFSFRNSAFKIPTEGYKGIIKFWMPWSMEVDSQLLLLPLPYMDEPQPFSACPGIYPTGVHTPIQVHVEWHKEGEFFLPAGTPLCQLIGDIVTSPMTEEFKKKEAAELFRSTHTFESTYRRTHEEETSPPTTS